MPLQKIGKMSLKNSGGFVARTQFSYLDDEGEKKLTEQSGDITLGFSSTEDPGDLGVPDGSTVYLHVFVIWGGDHEAQEAFVYEKGNTSIARYDVTGNELAKFVRLEDVA